MTDSNEITVKKNFEIMAEVQRSLTPEQLAVIKRTIAPTLNDDEMRLFLYRCHTLGLDPLKNEIYAYASSGKYGRQLTMIVSRDGKRVVASRSGLIEYYHTEPIYRKAVKDEKGVTTGYEKVEPWEGGELWGARTIGKLANQEKEFSVTVSLKEYNSGRNVWASKPETMIKKVAESQWLSMAVPDLAGVYDEAEMPEKNTAPTLPQSEDDNEKASDAQIETLKSLKVEYTEDITKGEAKQLILEATQGGKNE